MGQDVNRAGQNDDVSRATVRARADVGTASTRTKITVSVRFFTIANPVMVASCLPSEIGERNSVWGLRLCRPCQRANNASRLTAQSLSGKTDGVKRIFLKDMSGLISYLSGS